MSVITFDTGDKFIFRVFESVSQNMQDHWSTTFEAVAESPGGLADLQTLGTKLVGLVQGMTGSFVSLPQYSISTWEPDAQPYNPETFYVAPAGALVGSRTMTAPLGLDVCLLIKRKTYVGRSGRIFLRGALDEADVERQGTRFVLTDQSTMQDNLDAIVDALNLADYFTGGIGILLLSTIGISLGALTPHTMGVTGLEVNGVSINKMNHRWYDQAGRTLAAAKRKAARELAG